MLNNLPIATKVLLILNSVLFLAKLLLSQLGIAELSVVMGSFYPESINFHLWQPLTHLFMHAGVAHILFNMFALVMFGSTVERILGTQRFLILYFIAGLGAFLLFNAQSYFAITQLKSAVANLGLAPEIVNEAMKLDVMGTARVPRIFSEVPEIRELADAYITPMVGASGAIYGLLVMFGLLFPEAALMFAFIPVPVKAKYFIPGIILLELVLGLLDLSWNPVAHFAHLGGAVAGFVLYYIWKKRGVIYAH